MLESLSRLEGRAAAEEEEIARSSLALAYAGEAASHTASSRPLILFSLFL